jgi:hypothetical protein
LDRSDNSLGERAKFIFGVILLLLAAAKWIVRSVGEHLSNVRDDRSISVLPRLAAAASLVIGLPFRNPYASLSNIHTDSYFWWQHALVSLSFFLIISYVSLIQTHTTIRDLPPLLMHSVLVLLYFPLAQVPFVAGFWRFIDVACVISLWSSLEWHREKWVSIEGRRTLVDRWFYPKQPS